MQNFDSLHKSISDVDNYSPEAIAALQAHDLSQLMNATLPLPKPIIAPYIYSADLVMIYGWRGVGKTWFSLALAHAISNGTSFLGSECEQAKKVMYLDGEMVGGRLKSRLEQISKPHEIVESENLTTGNLKIVTRDLQDPEIEWPDLATSGGRESVNSLIKAHTPDVLIVDNISAWVRSGAKENDAESWRGMASWLLGLRSKGIAVVLIHHAGKNGGQRGTSVREDILDTVICLKQPNSYDQTEGLRVQLEFEKARNLDAGEVVSIEISLQITDGGANFDVLECKTDPITIAQELIADGANRQEIMETLNIDRHQLMRLRDRAIKIGRPFTLPDNRRKGSD